MKKYRTAIIVTLSCVALLAVVSGLYGALHSSLFLVQVVEVSDQPTQAPLDAHTITELAAIPVGLANLFDLDLKIVEKRLLANPWIREVRLQKRFPQTLAISVTYRQPQALMQSEAGALTYVDSEGRAFGLINLSYQSDLPLLTGFGREPANRVQEALRLLNRWEKSELNAKAQVTSISWEGAKGFRAVVTYPLEANSNRVGRALIDLGQEIDADPRLEEQFGHLSQVFDYLGRNRIAAHQIWADAGKKIVVKTAHGS